MTASPEFTAHLQDLFAPMGAVRIKRMFGGAGVYCDGLMFGLVSDDTLYLKAGEASRGDFEAEGMRPFVYRMKKGRSGTMSYFGVPDRLFDEPEEMLTWGRKALAAARGAKRR